MGDKDLSTQENLDNSDVARGTCEDDLAALEVTVAGLTASNIALRAERDQLRSDLNSANQIISDLNDQIAVLTIDKNNLILELGAANNAIADLNSQITDLNGEVTNLNAQIEDLANQLNSCGDGNLIPELDFFSLKKSSWNSKDKKFLIELGSKVSEDSFQVDGDVYTIDKIEEDNKARLLMKKSDFSIFEISGNSSDIQITTKDNKLFIELDNIEKLQDIEKFKSRIDYNAEGASKLNDLLYVVNKYTSTKKIYYFNQLRSI